VRILVVEDVPDVAATFAALLRAYGHRTHVAADGTSALRIAREFKPEIVFIDIGLPGMDGYELAAHLRSMNDLARPLLISVSGREIDDERFKEVGLDRKLTKPVTVGSLMEILAS
jgi:two-component system CheB/CheR fusion protein